jgi:hypothetical protein
VDDDRQFLYALAAGAVITGLLFWLAFWHGRILLAIVWGLTLFFLTWGRYGGLRQWQDLHRQGTRHKIQQYEAFVVLVALFFVATCVILEIKGVLPK